MGKRKQRHREDTTSSREALNAQAGKSKRLQAVTELIAARVQCVCFNVCDMQISFVRGGGGRGTLVGCFFLY